MNQCGIQMIKKIEWVIYSVISLCALVSSLSSKATHQKLKLTSQNKGLFLDTSPKRYASRFVGFLQWIRQLNLNSVPWTCNLTVFLTKMWYADKGININVGRKTNMSRAHAQAHKKQVTSGTIIPKQEGFYTRFCPSEGRFLFHAYTKLALRCMFAVRDSFLADYHTSMDVSAGALLTYDCMRGVST